MEKTDIFVTDISKFMKNQGMTRSVQIFVVSLMHQTVSFSHSSGQKLKIFYAQPQTVGSPLMISAI